MSRAGRGARARAQLAPHGALRYHPGREVNSGWREGGSERGLGRGGSRPRLATQGARLPAHRHPFAPHPSPSRGPLKAPARPHQPLPTHPRPPVPASPALSVSRSCRKMEARILPDQSLRAHTTAHAHRAPRRALRYRLAHSLLPVSPSYLLAPSRGSFTHSDFNSYATTLTPKGFCSHRQMSRPGGQRWR